MFDRFNIFSIINGLLEPLCSNYFFQMGLEEKLLVRGLTAFVSGLVGKKIIVELRAGTYVIGRLENCDCYLNLRVNSATVIRYRSSEYADQFFISGKHIRYVHLDNYLDVVTTVNRAVKNMRRGPVRKARGGRTANNRQLK